VCESNHFSGDVDVFAAGDFYRLKNVRRGRVGEPEVSSRANEYRRVDFDMGGEAKISRDIEWLGRGIALIAGADEGEKIGDRRLGG